jgi:hypothetical protein
MIGAGATPSNTQEDDDANIKRYLDKTPPLITRRERAAHWRRPERQLEGGRAHE